MKVTDTEIFLALEKTRSLSRAADQLYMSRPGLSQRLSAIEADYGQKLFERTSSGVQPTKAGAIVTRYAREMRQLEDALEAELAAGEEHFSTDIEVGMSLNDGAELLPGAVAAFARLHPEALVHLEAAYEPGLVEKVRAGKLDFALVENCSVDESLSRKLLGYDVLEFCAPAAPPYTSASQPVKVETLLKWPMIIYEWNSGRHMVGNRYFRERYGISLMEHNLVARFDTHEAMVNGVRAGLGWASVPRCIARRYRNDPALIWFSVDTEEMRYPVEMIWRTDRACPPLARAFRDFVADFGFGDALLSEKSGS